MEYQLQSYITWPVLNKVSVTSNCHNSILIHGRAKTEITYSSDLLYHCLQTHDSKNTIEAASYLFFGEMLAKLGRALCTALQNKPQHTISGMINNMSGSRGGTGGPEPPPLLKNHKNTGFPSNVDLDPLKITKLPNQHSMVGHYRRFAVGRWWLTFYGISILSPS